MSRKIGKRTAERIAKSGKITWGEIQATLRRAYEAGAANEDRAVVNKNLSKATVFNLVCEYAVDRDPDSAVDSETPPAWISARRALIEFGQFWQGWTPEPKAKRALPAPSHQPAIEPPF